MEDDELKHWGVLGMHWGVTKDQSSSPVSKTSKGSVSSSFNTIKMNALKNIKIEKGRLIVGGLIGSAAVATIYSGMAAVLLNELGGRRGVKVGLQYATHVAKRELNGGLQAVLKTALEYAKKVNAARVAKQTADFLMKNKMTSYAQIGVRVVDSTFI